MKVKHKNKKMNFATKCVILMIAVAAVMMPVDAYAKKVKKDLYLFGCSASFTDSIIYITDVQVIENANTVENAGKQRIIFQSVERVSC